ncbi:MAG TPA: septum formation initiator family protein [Candidatus Saccharimonadales bacterium]|jgi:cell division protein FtsB
MLDIFKNTKKYSNHALLSQLRDVQSLGLIVFTVIVLLVSWSGVKAIQSNYKLEQQIARLQQESDLQRLQNSNQKLKNQYYNTPQYLELAARQNFGLALPGEKELIVPKKVAMARVSGVQVASSTAATQPGSEAADKKQPFYQRNIQAWMNFFLHRGLAES